MAAKKNVESKKSFDHQRSTSPHKSSSKRNRREEEPSPNEKFDEPYNPSVTNPSGNSKKSGSNSNDPYDSGSTSKRDSSYDERYDARDDYLSGNSKKSRTNSNYPFDSGGTSKRDSSYDERYDARDVYSSGNSKKSGSNSNDPFDSGGTSKRDSSYDERYENRDDNSSGNSKKAGYLNDPYDSGSTSKRDSSYDERYEDRDEYHSKNSKKEGSNSNKPYNSGGTAKRDSSYDERYEGRDDYPSGNSKKTRSYSNDPYDSGGTAKRDSSYDESYEGRDDYSSGNSKKTGSYSNDPYDSGGTAKRDSSYDDRYENRDDFSGRSGEKPIIENRRQDQDSNNQGGAGSTLSKNDGGDLSSNKMADDDFSNPPNMSSKGGGSSTGKTGRRTEETHRLRVHFRNSYEEFRQEVISPTTQDRGRGLGRWVVYRSDPDFPIRLIEASPAHLREIHQQFRNLSLRQGHMVELQITIIREDGIARSLHILSLNPEIIDFEGEDEIIAPREFRNLPERAADAHHKLLRGMNRLFNSSYGLDRPGDSSYGDNRVAAMPWLSRINGFVHGIYRILNTRVSNRFMNDQRLTVSRSLISSQNDHADSYRSGGDLAVNIWNNDLTEPERWAIREPTAKRDVLIRILRNYMNEDRRINGEITTSREWEGIYQDLMGGR